MLKRVKAALTGKIISIKQMIKANKAIILIFCAVALLGVVSGIVAFAGEIGDYDSLSVTEKMQSGDFGYVLLYIKLLIVPTAIIFACLALGFNKIAYLINLPLAFLYCRIFVKHALLNCFCGGFSGYIFFIVYYLPIFLINFAVFLLVFAEYYHLACCGWKYITPLKCISGAWKKLLKKYLIFLLVFNLVYTSLILLIFSLI